MEPGGLWTCAEERSMEQIWPEKKERGNPPERFADISRRSGTAYVQECSAKLHAYAISILLPFICALLFSILLLFLLLSRPLHNLPFITRSPLPAFYSGAPGGKRGRENSDSMLYWRRREGTVATHVQKMERRPLIVGQKCTIVRYIRIAQYSWFFCVFSTKVLPYGLRKRSNLFLLHNHQTPLMPLYLCPVQPCTQYCGLQYYSAAQSTFPDGAIKNETSCPASPVQSFMIMRHKGGHFIITFEYHKNFSVFY